MKIDTGFENHLLVVISFRNWLIARSFEAKHDLLQLKNRSNTATHIIFIYTLLYKTEAVLLYTKRRIKF